MQNPIIDVHHLTKNFGRMEAVKQVSFSIHPSEIFAFLGPNGAGKTTTIKMLITLLRPSAGDAIVDGHSLIQQPSEVRRTIGYVPQMISVDGSLTAVENLTLMARLYDVPGRERKTRIAEMLAFLNLEKYADSLVRTLSGGMIRKLEIGQAMLHRPRILFLDEPTAGVDPLGKRNIWRHLLDLRKTFGTTVFFSTHNLEEAEGSADRVAIMDTGKITAIGSVAELKSKSQKSSLEEAFVFFAGKTIEMGGNFREIRSARKTQRRLG